MLCKKCEHKILEGSDSYQSCGNHLEQTTRSNPRNATIEKGYAYLELKRWAQATACFEAAIVSGEDKARAYIGRLLAKLRFTDVSALLSGRKPLSRYDDYQMALKYADGAYKEQLGAYMEQHTYRLQFIRKKQKKTLVIACITMLSVLVLGALAYYVAIPFGRLAYYKNELNNENTAKAVKAYTNSRYFEYHGKVKAMFYAAGVFLVENEKYAEAQPCFTCVGNYREAENYFNYCKGKILLKTKDLEAYNYFVKCRNFLDAQKILNTNKYFVAVNELQGKWYHPEKVVTISKSKDIWFTPVDSETGEEYKLTYVAEEMLVDQLQVGTIGDLVILNERLAIKLLDGDFSTFDVTDGKMVIDRIGIRNYSDIVWTKLT